MIGTFKKWWTLIKRYWYFILASAVGILIAETLSRCGVPYDRNYYLFCIASIIALLIVRFALKYRSLKDEGVSDLGVRK